MQKGDVLSTHADPSRLQQHVGYVAKTNVDEGGHVLWSGIKTITN